jgi:hypothetical protein
MFDQGASGNAGTRLVTTVGAGGWMDLQETKVADAISMYPMLRKKEK